MIDKEKKNDYRFDVNFKDVSKCDQRSKVMESVQQFSDYGVRVGDSVEYRIPGSVKHDYVRGMISELRKDGIRVKIFDSEVQSRYANLPKSLFDEFKLEIFDDNRGCDNSAIGLSGCYEPWRNMWW